MHPIHVARVQPHLFSLDDALGLDASDVARDPDKTTFKVKVQGF